MDKELLTEECPNCGYVLDPVEVDAKKFFAGQIGLQVCPDCRTIVPPCNSCNYLLQDINWCNNCPYRLAHVEVVNVEKFKRIEET